MDANAVYAAVAVGIFLLLCLVAWHLVLVLRQARRTALAMEEFLVATRPKVETAADRLGSLLGRADRFLVSMEGEEGTAGAAGLLGRALSGWMTGTQTISAIAAAIASIMQAWATLTRGRPPAGPETGAAAGPAAT